MSYAQKIPASGRETILKAIGGSGILPINAKKGSTPDVAVTVAMIDEAIKREQYKAIAAVVRAGNGRIMSKYTCTKSQSQSKPFDWTDPKTGRIKQLQFAQWAPTADAVELPDLVFEEATEIQSPIANS